jgi:uncharacterized protein YjbI with pentapeptide repeats
MFARFTSKPTTSFGVVLATMASMSITPIAPKLSSAGLDLWDEDVTVELEIDGTLVRNQDLSSVTKLYADGSRFEGVALTGALLDKCELTDVACAKLEAAALQAYKANLLRVSLSDCRLTGVEFAEACFEDCTFKNVKFDQAGFRFASFKRVRFENCMLQQADFSNAQLSHVVFVECSLNEANFVSANCSSTNITGEDLTNVKGILGLKGATISSEQLMQLAPLLAAELGFRIED